MVAPENTVNSPAQGRRSTQSPSLRACPGLNASMIHTYSATEPVSASAFNSLPEVDRQAVLAQLGERENVLACLEVDLDARLRFARGLLILTGNRLLTCQAGTKTWQSWPLQPDLNLTHFDHAGVATLELVDAAACLASWRYTLAQSLAALRLLDEFEKRIEFLKTGHLPSRESEAICVTCKAPLPPGEDECPICTRELYTPPSTWTLFRLWRFAKPYQGQLLVASCS